MRLAQLARKIGTTQNQIVTLLAKHQQDLPEHGNAKLDEKQLAIVLDHYKPEAEALQDDQEIVEEDIPSEVQSSEPIPEIEAITESEETLNETVLEHQVPQETTEEPEEKPEIEVIKAKKIKLEGIKVLGKIDLPEPKPKEPKTEGQAKEKKTTDRRGKRRVPSKRSTLSFEEKLKRNEKEAERKRLQREKNIKEKKKRYYFEEIQPKVGSKATSTRKKTKKKPIKTQAQVSVRKKPTPTYKNPIKKLWGWLNGEYDRF